MSIMYDVCQCTAVTWDVVDGFGREICYQGGHQPVMWACGWHRVSLMVVVGYSGDKQSILLSILTLLHFSVLFLFAVSSSSTSIIHSLVETLGLTHCILQPRPGKAI